MITRAALGNVQEGALKFARKLREQLACIVREANHRPLMAVRIDVALEAVLIATLLLAHLTEPPELLEALRLRGEVEHRAQMMGQHNRQGPHLNLISQLLVVVATALAHLG